MSIGSWSPDNATSTSRIDESFLLRCIDYVNTGEVDQLAGRISEQDQQQSAVMHADQQLWDSALEKLDNEQLVALIRFFTLAEMQLPGWEAGSQSPVIAINQQLKQRGEKLDRETLLWIRQHSTNRFIPNGAVL